MCRKGLQVFLLRIFLTAINLTEQCCPKKKIQGLNLLHLCLDKDSSSCFNFRLRFFSKIYVATVFPLFRTFLLQSKKKVQWHVGRAQRLKSLVSSRCPQFEFFQRPSDASLAPFPQMSKYYIVRKTKWPQWWVNISIRKKRQ